MAAYQTTLPSLRAASTSAGVTALGSGAAARTAVAKTPAAIAAQPPSTSRLENPMLRMASAPAFR
jgi:F0F1-type ATP synthase membrane subunit c/vacuolar-type H+-ATPase subunit K